MKHLFVLGIALSVGCVSSGHPTVDAAPPDALGILPDAAPSPDTVQLPDASPQLPDASLDATPAVDRFSVNDALCTMDIATFLALYPSTCPATYAGPPPCSAATVTECGAGAVTVIDSRGLGGLRCDYHNGKLVAARVESDVLSYCGNTAFSINAGEFVTCTGGTTVPHCVDGGARD
jgi:hypothetical protein